MILALLIAIAAWLMTLVLPWWSVAFAGLIFGALLGKTGWSSFGWGFAGVGGLWLIQTLYLQIASDGILTARIGDLFSLPSPVLIIGITLIVGGLIGGFTTLTGYLCRKVFAD